MKLVVGLVGNATGCGVCRCANGLEVEAAPEGLESNDDEDNDDEQYIKRNLPRTCGHVDTTSAMQTTLPRPCGQPYLGHADTPTPEMRTTPTSVMQKRPTAAMRMLHASDVRTRPTSEMRARPTLDVRTLPTSVMRMFPTSDMRTRPTSDMRMWRLFVD